MKLKSILDKTMNDYDTYDTEFDACVTCCYIDEEEFDDYYGSFCKKLYELVEVVDINSSLTLIVDWSGFVKRHLGEFYDFEEDYFGSSERFDCEDDFVFEWIDRFHYLLAGYASEEDYEYYLRLLENVEMEMC